MTRYRQDYHVSSNVAFFLIGCVHHPLSIASLLVSLRFFVFYCYTRVSLKRDTPSEQIQTGLRFIFTTQEREHTATQNRKPSR